jgi:hypothetical protein
MKGRAKGLHRGTFPEEERAMDPSGAARAEPLEQTDAHPVTDVQRQALQMLTLAQRTAEEHVASALCQVRDDLPRFQNPDLQILALSVDSPYALKSYARSERYDFPLLADFWPHGGVARAYGVFNDISGMANRGTFLIDKDGVVRFAEMNAPGEARDQSVWQKAIADLAP